MLKGSIVALVTPFNADQSVNYQKLEELLNYHLEHQTDGIVILGTTGEATTLTMEEKVKIVELAVSVVDNRIPLIAGAGGNDTKKALDEVRMISNLGVDYILSITPYYNKTNETGLIRHFEMIADVSSCPVILYNVPARTGMSISPNAIATLSLNPNICGIKEASGDISYATEIAKYLSDNFIMLSGNDDIIVPMMSIGAKGVISVLANICPYTTHMMCSYCEQNDYSNARRLQVALYDLIKALFSETNPIPVKAACNFLGFAVGGYRMPLYDMNKEKEIAMIQVILKNKELIL